VGSGLRSILFLCGSLVAGSLWVLYPPSGVPSVGWVGSAPLVGHVTWRDGLLALRSGLDKIITGSTLGVTHSFVLGS